MSVIIILGGRGHPARTGSRDRTPTRTRLPLEGRLHTMRTRYKEHNLRPPMGCLNLPSPTFIMANLPAP